MRIACSAPSAFLLTLVLGAAALARAPVTTLALGGGGSLEVHAARGLTSFELHAADGTKKTVSVDRDATVAPGSAPSEVKLVGTIEAGAGILVIDAYPSVPRGMHYCQAGVERFLRLLATSPGRETLRIKLDSCLDNIELATDGIHFDPATGLLRVSWLQGPSGRSKPETLEISLQPKPAAPPHP